VQRGAIGKAAPRPLGAILHELGHLSLLQINAIQELVESAKRRRSIEGFDVLAKLGKGATSSVYLARQVSLDKLVALKVLPRKLAASPETLRRFKREALATAKMNHPGIVQAYDVGESNGFHFLVMEYIQGETLRDLIEREGRLEEKHAIDLAIAVVHALAHAAEHRVVHRDVKPANIMLTKAGEPKLCDLGLAISKRDEGKITSVGVIMGTPYYLSPEQARNEELDERSDLYSLGATLFHAVTGVVPYDGDSPASIIARHWMDPVPDPRERAPALSDSLAALVMRLLAKDPEERYQSCEELLADLLELKRAGTLAPGSHTRSERIPSAAAGTGGALERSKSVGRDDDRTQRADGGGGDTAGIELPAARASLWVVLVAFAAGLAIGVAIGIAVGAPLR